MNATDGLDSRDGLAPSTAPRPAGGPQHFAFVDSLRGIAILGVIMVHACLSSRGLHWRVHQFAMSGRFGVQLFFVVSAFTLFWSLDARGKVEARPLAAFYTRRFFRIAPLFYLAAIVYTLIRWETPSMVATHGVGVMTFISTLLFVHGWHPVSVNTVVPGGWSIGAEAMFYLCIPMLFRWVRSLNAALWLSLIGAVCVSFLQSDVLDTKAIAVKVVWRWMQHHGFTPDWFDQARDFVYFSFPIQLPVFCLGMVLYFLLRDRMKATTHTPTVLPPARESNKRLATFLFALCAYVLFCPIPPHIAAAAAFVALAYALSLSPLFLLVNRLTRFVGMISFSAYIWHFWILKILVHPLSNATRSMNPNLRLALLYLITLALTLMVAMASYYLIEVPGQALGKKLIARAGWGRPKSAGRIAELPATAVRAGAAG